jgi:N6-L-threonylcarbamoyladenine synthase
VARREANVRLVPAIEALFSQNGLSKEDLSCVVCGRGPGSFTGVRIAVATAKGIAAGLGVPLFGVATPDALAWQAWEQGIRGNVAVLSDAMRGEIYPAQYILDEQGAQRKDPLTVIKAEALAEKWSDARAQSEQPLTLMGDALYKHGELFASFTWLDETFWYPQGTGLLKAFEALPETAKESGSIATLLPLYVRLSDAEENERRRLAAGGEIAQGALTALPASGVAWPLQAGQLSFRPAALSDFTKMFELEQRISAFKDEFGKPNHSWWVCYEADTLVGYGGGGLIDSQMHVHDLVVNRSYRRRGVARKLLGLLAQDAMDWGAVELTLEVRVSNDAAQALYKKCGLQTVGSRKAYFAPRQSGEPREDALIMTGAVEGACVEIGTNRNTLEAPAEPPLKTPLEAPAEAPLEAPAAGASHDLETPHPLILALESSCDETAAALVDGSGRLLSNVVASQTDFHARFGGVVPEIASRKHTEAIYPTVMEAMGTCSWQDLDAIAVTYAPGLVGALVVGLAFAKGLSWATGVSLIKVDHLEGHIYANRFAKAQDSYYLDSEKLRPPFVIALLSGGNTMLVYVRNWGEYEVLGQTLDDAVGEAYDKVAKALGLGYPGGPIIARLASEGNPQAIAFPRALLHSGDYRFSLSGLKTAVLTAIREQTAAGTLNLADMAASFEQAVIEVQVAKALKACNNLKVKTFCIGGGVAANKALRKAYKAALEPEGIEVLFPPELACTDNAAMIAAVALDRYSLEKFACLSDDAAAQSHLEQAY